VLTWPQLKDAEKRAKYSEFACHELNFFLSKKDPAFFAAVGEAVSREQERQDLPRRLAAWRDLARYLEPWTYGG
jgi:hypothetical protein